MFFVRFHHSDRRVALAKAFLKLKYHIPQSDDFSVVPPAVKKIFKQNEFVLWPLFVHYSHNEMAIPKITKGSSAHRKKRVSNILIHIY